MKKFLCLIMSVLVILSSVLFVACDDSKEEGTTGTSETESATESATESTTESATESEVETLEGGAIVVDSINGKDAFDVLNSFSVNEMDNYTLSSTTISSSEYGASKTVATINATLAVDGDRVYCSTTSPDTPYMDGELWYDNGWMYTKSDEEKYKEQIDFADFLEMYVDVSLSGSSDEDAPTKEELEGAVIVKYEDGSYGIRLDAAKIMEELYEETESEDIEIFDEFSSMDVSIEIFINADESLKGFCVEMITEMDMDGITLKTSTKATYYIEKVGTTTVTLPSDADTYEEFDWGFDDEIPDMSDWSEEEIESWYEEYFGSEFDEEY